jgi:hypothetical protein
VRQLAAQDHDQLLDHDRPSDQAQLPALPHGVPYDWSHHHLIFSNPGTAEDAMRKGTYDHWFQITNDPRYIQHQIWTLRRKLDDGPREIDRRHEDANTGLWGQSLGSASATVGAGMYPAKYSFTGNTLSCANVTGQPDFVVYNTSVAGTGTQATVVAYDNLYSGTCPTTGGYTVPQVYWSYNTSGLVAATVSTSVVLSTYGNPIAFVQSSGGVASLVILRFAPGQGTTAAAPVPPGNTYTCAVTTGVCGTEAAAFLLCEKSPGSCALVLQFSKDGAATTSPNDTNSPPYYDYDPGSDTIWVGDDSGYIHKFTGVFDGTATEVTTGGWPVQASTETSPILTGAVYDSTSKLLFVNDASGFLHSVNATTPTGSALSSVVMECGQGFKDPPVVDSTAEEVYDFIAYGCDTTHNSYINKFAAGTPINNGTGYGTALSFANGSTTTNPASSVARDGSFDNTYYSGTGTTGNLYYCEDGRVYQISVGAFTVATFDTPVSTRNNTSNCSPITEYYGTSATTTLSGNLGNGNGNHTADVVSTTGFTVGAGTYYVQIDSEIMLLTAVTAGPPATLTLTRGQLGTGRAMHNSGATVNEIHDWLFLSVLGNGNGANCTGSCLYNYDVLSGAATGTTITGMPVVGGTSGISIDNTALNGGSQIYFTYLSAATSGIVCPSPSGGPGTGATTGGCAVQATQLGLN